jgi:hypothetical protein
MMPEITPRIIDRFFAKTFAEGDCNEWSGRLNEDGYGLFVIGHSKTYLAHRVAYRIHESKWPDGLVLHSCDNRKCVKYEHLRIGTQAENVADMMARGRNVPPMAFKGEKNPQAKLTLVKVKSIKSLYLNGGTTQAAIAKQFNVSQASVHLIVTGKRWI